MVIYYFGADEPWSELLKTGFRRRNTCILKALVASEMVEKVYVIRKTTRKALLKQIFSPPTLTGKVHDIVFADFFPNDVLGVLGISGINSFISRRVIKKQSANHTSKHWIWAYWPKGYRTAIESGLEYPLIFDADHNIIEDPNLPVSIRPEREKILLEIGTKANWILSSTISMINWFHTKGFYNTVRLRNGVELERFHQKANKKEGNDFRVVYCGTLSRWIDYEMFAKIVANHPQWEFTIIGKPFKNTDWELLKAYGNVCFRGEKTADEVAELLPGFDAAVNLYRRHPALDVDSMKLYEYLAVGLPVVSTRFHDMLEEDFEGNLLLGDDISQIESHLESLYQGKCSCNKSVSDFLESSTWQKRVDGFISKLV